MHRVISSVSKYGGDIVNLETGEKVDNDTYLDLLDKLAIHGDSDETQ